MKHSLSVEEANSAGFLVCDVVLTFHIFHVFTGQHEEEYRRQLGRYGVIGDLALRPVRSLSGGQKSRLVMALMSMTR